MGQNTALPEFRKKIGVGITGASGFIYGLKLLEELVMRSADIHYTISPNAIHIARIEHGLDVDIETGVISGYEELSEKSHYYHHSHVGAAPASGSFGLNSVVIAPCSMGTLARIATGTSEGLVGRMADVALKERHQLILVPRETPYSTIQLRNMTTLSECGAVIMPASPGYYHRPQSVDDMVNFVIARILQHLGYDGKPLVKGGWGTEPMASQKRLDQ